ncbi:hypothetical protein AAFN75_09940 [Algibacter sp. AS12]|uniref:hypothetical protein n=1 Tax=Algibacter sp. AS12 TaxID=3135773 RepID=UPI00398B0123
MQSIDKNTIEKLYQYSGISKEEYQLKLNKPDTLKQLIKYFEKHINDAKPRRGFQLKVEITHEELVSKNTPTGVSLEEAILLLQNDVKVNLTPEKIKKIDSVSGTKILSELSEKDVKMLSDL